MPDKQPSAEFKCVNEEAVYLLDEALWREEQAAVGVVRYIDDLPASEPKRDRQVWIDKVMLLEQLRESLLLVPNCFGALTKRRDLTFPHADSYYGDPRFKR